MGGLMLVVVAAMLTTFLSMQGTAARESARSEATDDLRTTMQRITKETRQALRVRAASGPSVLDIDTYVNGIETRVTYQLTADSLTRTADGTTVRLLQRVSQPAIFEYEPPLDQGVPSVVKITLTARPEKFIADPVEITMKSEVKLRNGA